MIGQRPPREHQRSHFTRRLEAFSDIVFGLCLAQTAVQLEVPSSLSDLVNGHFVLRLLIFFATFALIAQYWLAHYRMFRLAFEPERADIFLNFAFLALTALLPFTMQVNIKFGGAPLALGLYAVNLMLTSLVMSRLLARGLARRDPTLAPEERLQLWMAALRNRVLIATSALALVVMLVLPVPWTGMAGFAFPLMVPAMLFIRRHVTSVPARYLPAP